MNNDIWGTLITTLLGGIPAVIAVVLSNRSHDKVVDEKMKNTDLKIEQLSSKVDKYCEKETETIKELAVTKRDLETAFIRIDELREEVHIIKNAKEKK